MTYNWIASILFFLVFVVLFLPLEKPVGRFLEVKPGRITLSIILVFSILVLLILKGSFLSTVQIFFSIISVWVFLFGFLSNRQYIYMLALIFLVLCPVFLIAGLDEIAEYSAILSYLSLVLGVARDILYEKIIEN